MLIYICTILCLICLIYDLIMIEKTKYVYLLLFAGICTLIGVVLSCMQLGWVHWTLPF